MLKVILSFILLLSFVFKSNAQTSEFDSNQFDNFIGGKYLYKNQIYSYKQLGTLFKDQAHFSSWYNKAMNRKKAAAILGGLAISVGGIGTILVGQSCEDLGCLAIMYPFAIGSLFGLISFYEIIIFYVAKKKSINALKGNLDQSYLSQKSSISISLGLSPHGVGILFRF